MTAEAFLAQLAGGDRRSIGHADAVAGQVLAEPDLFDALWAGLDHPDPLVRMRAADALEKVTARRPDLLLPRKAELIRRLGDAGETEVRWHLVQMVPRLPLTAAERAEVLVLLQCHLSDRSSIVKTSALQSIADLAAGDEALRAGAVDLLERFVRSGTPAMKARGRKLLVRLRGG